VQDYKSLCAAVTICATLVKIQTDTQTAFDQLIRKAVSQAKNCNKHNPILPTALLNSVYSSDHQFTLRHRQKERGLPMLTWSEVKMHDPSWSQPHLAGKGNRCYCSQRFSLYRGDLSLTGAVRCNCSSYVNNLWYKESPFNLHLLLCVMF